MKSHPQLMKWLYETEKSYNNELITYDSCMKLLNNFEFKSLRYGTYMRQITLTFRSNYVTVLNLFFDRNNGNCKEILIKQKLNSSNKYQLTHNLDLLKEILFKLEEVEYNKNNIKLKQAKKQKFKDINFAERLKTIIKKYTEEEIDISVAVDPSFVKIYNKHGTKVEFKRHWPENKKAMNDPEAMEEWLESIAPIFLLKQSKIKLKNVFYSIEI